MQSGITVWVSPLVAAVGILLPPAAAGAGAQEAPAAGGEASQQAFTLRVDPRWAPEVNAVLREMAEPIEVDAASAERVTSALARQCGAAFPLHVDPAPGETSTKVRLAPCVRFLPRAEVTARPGDTLEGIAVRSGLSPAAAEKMAVQKGGETDPEQIPPESLDVGDAVVVERLPRWTPIVARPGVDRESFVRALAKRLSCDTTDIKEAEACLVSRRVFLLDSQSPKQRPTNPTTSPGSPPHDEGAALLSHGILRALLRKPPRGSSASLAANSAFTSAAPVAAPPPGVAPVAPEQWPYDAKLLAALLIAQQASIQAPAVIGVADGGLADAKGAPLPPSVFVASQEPDVSNGQDDDGNGYFDDAFGGGTWSADQPERSGDVSLCPLQTSFSTWGDVPRACASHGAVVSSVAAALRVRNADTQAAALLPRIAFFRMLTRACEELDGCGVEVGDMMTALEYFFLFRRGIDIVNVSYRINSARGQQFVAAAEGYLSRGERFLVLPAGNDEPGDLDQNPRCPACLANIHYAASRRTVNRTLVVGAATRRLQIADYSNFGDETVSVFAPGEPVDTLDVTGHTSSAAGATSYAAPYAALAVAILKSFGENDALQIRSRLQATTWPLYDASGRRKTAGVIDLVKVAAVQRDAVEVLEPVGGGVVRRTYVGDLQLDEGTITPCPGLTYQQSAFHAIRLGEPNAAGRRRLWGYHRSQWQPPDRLRIYPDGPCETQGTVRLRTLDGQDKQFQMSDVTLILLRWLL